MVDFCPDDTPELQAWRREVRATLEALIPDGMRFDYDYDEDPDRWAAYLAFWRGVGAKGYVSVTWPKEYYGLGLSPIHKWIVQEEFADYGVPSYPVIGLNVATPLLRHGTHAQRLKHLEGIARVTTLWGEGYSEPGSGSDLASLTTRAHQDGDYWVLNGQKTLGTAAHHCQWMLALARTDPNGKAHNSITAFMIPLDTPGISMAPLHNMADGQQNHTFFDNVRVHKDNVLGDVNQAWTQIWFGMGGEALDPAGPTPELWELRIQEMLNDIILYCRQTQRNGAPLSQDPVIRLQLAELMMGVEVLKLDFYEMYSDAVSADRHGGRSSTLNLDQAFFKELWPRLAQTCLEITGPLALLHGGKWSVLNGRVERYFRASFGNHAGGTSQLKRMALATRGLGLPR